MAKRKPRKNTKKSKPSKKIQSAAKEKVNKVIDQVKEPFSLLGTLKDEGLSSAMMFISMASGMASEAKKNFRIESIKPQLQELIHSMGFIFKSDLEKLEARMEELEDKIAQIEYQKLSDEEE